MHRISEMLEANIGVAEDLLTIRSLLSAGIELSKNRDAISHVEYANKIWDHQTIFTHGSRGTFRTNAKRHPGLLAIYETTKPNSLSISTIDKYHRPTTTRNKPFGQQCCFEKLVLQPI